MRQIRYARRPFLRPGGEAEPKGLALARKQGETYRRTVEHMSREVAQRGRARRAGDYTIGYAVEEAEGMYHFENGLLRWEEPAEGENLHVEVVVMDGADGRFLPGLEVFVTLFDAEGHEIGTHAQPFLWHPYLFHYGRNWRLPGDGEYTIRIRVEPPRFMRHDRVNGVRYTEPVVVEFTGVEVKTGHD